MQSSYKVIKNNSIRSSGLRKITTDIDVVKQFDPEVDLNIKDQIDSYENLAKTILENARKQSERIISKAYEDASNIEEEAVRKSEILKRDAYEKGLNEGYNKGYNEAIERVNIEREMIMSEAHEILVNAKIEYENYMENKSKELKDLILTIAKSALKRELQDNGLINNMIFEALEDSKKATNFIIRCNSLHLEELKSQINNWKEQLGFFGDIFVLKDDGLEPGNAVIDKGNGKIVVGIDYALLRIKEILDGKD